MQESGASQILQHVQSLGPQGRSDVTEEHAPTEHSAQLVPIVLALFLTVIFIRRIIAARDPSAVQDEDVECW